MSDVELRPATVDDVHAIGELIRRAEASDEVPRIYTDGEVADDFASPFVDLGRDTLLAVVDGQVVGWAMAWHPGSEGALERVDLFGEVDPAHRGTGIGRRLFGWSLDRGREQLAESTTAANDAYIRVDAPDWREDRHRLYRRFGLQPSRWTETLLRPLTDLPDPADPPGIRSIPWPEDRADDTRRVRNEAFADHWGEASVSATLWDEMVHSAGGRPDLSFAAVDEDDAVVGICFNRVYPEDEEVTGRKEALIATVGTVRAARGRGIASALIVRSLHAFADAGFDHAVLNVDAENPTGARRLYTALGFEPDHRFVTYTTGATA